MKKKTLSLIPFILVMTSLSLLSIQLENNENHISVYIESSKQNAPAPISMQPYTYKIRLINASPSPEPQPWASYLFLGYVKNDDTQIELIESWLVPGTLPAIINHSLGKIKFNEILAKGGRYTINQVRIGAFAGGKANIVITVEKRKTDNGDDAYMIDTRSFYYFNYQLQNEMQQYYF